jgi:hypothetical protein
MATAILTILSASLNRFLGRRDRRGRVAAVPASSSPGERLVQLVQPFAGRFVGPFAERFVERFVGPFAEPFAERFAQWFAERFAERAPSTPKCPPSRLVRSPATFNERDALVMPATS